MPTISALVPFYNEAGRIGPVLKSLKQSQYLDAIVAVNDGSTDESLKEARAVPGITVIDAPHGGKSAAVKRGLADIKSQYVLMVDADIGAFDVTQIDPGLTVLGQPVGQVVHATAKQDRHQDRLVDMVLFFKYQPWYHNPPEVDFLTGQRVMPVTDLGLILAAYQSKGFELETDINDFMYQHQRGVVWIQTDISHQTKFKKHGLISGAVGTVDMAVDLLQSGTLQKFWQWKKVWHEVNPAMLASQTE